MRCYALRLIISLFDLLESNQSSNGAAAGAGNDQADEDAQQEQQPQAEQQQGAMKLPSATLMQVQATLLMHVSTMLRYDAALGNEWVKWVSGEGGAASTNYFLLQVSERACVYDIELRDKRYKWYVMLCCNARHCVQGYC
jgi:hypothetical protein